jgi:hypothetical protein
VVRTRLHPTHRPVMTRLKPALEIEPRGVGSIGAREATGGETEPLRFRSYCFLKALTPIHAFPLARPSRFP